MEELSRKQREFTAITENMSEGFVLIDNRGAVLSHNTSAVRIMDPEAVGNEALDLSRFGQFRQAVTTALSGQHWETMLERAGRIYQVVANPVTASGQVTGALLFMMDVTEKEQREQLRREFTANVSHELKTPLQSIMGSAELMENGLVKPEDMPVFIGRIRSEAARLVTLIEDIIRLSQLDEGVEMPVECVELYALAQETAQSLSDAAEAKSISLTVTGQPVTVHSVRRLLSEILYNLCDNAIKYNVPGGRVSVDVAGTAEGAAITVSDTGIGIPAEHQARVFERFYRVDKSHSRASGGTGLGLSIVKHAVQDLGGTIHLDSTPGQGTSIRVTIPERETE